MTVEAPKVLIALSTKGLKPFTALASASGPRRFRKAVLRVGEWVYPDTGEPLVFTRKDLEALARDTNAWIGLGHRVWFPDGHTSSALANLGFCEHFAVEGDELLCEFEVPDSTVAAKVGSTIVDVSVGIEWNARASDGTEFPAVIYHVAATPCPVIPGQTNFVQLSADRVVRLAQEKQTMAENKADKAPENKAEMAAAEGGDLLAQIKGLLGLDAGADDATVLAAIQQALEDDEVVVPDGGAAVTTPLARQAEADRAHFAKELEKVKSELAREREARVQVEIDSVRERLAAAGLPLEEDTRKLAHGLFSRGLESDARSVLKLAVARAEDRKLMLAQGVEVFENPAAKNAELEAKKSATRATAEGLRSQGYTVELSKDETQIVKKIPPVRPAARGRR